jgi:hypothetical protein
VHALSFELALLEQYCAKNFMENLQFRSINALLFSSIHHLRNSYTSLFLMAAAQSSNCLIIFARRFKKQEKKMRWNFKNMSSRLLKLSVQSFVKYATEGRFGPFFGVFTEPLVALLQQSTRPILKIPTPIFFNLYLVS